MSQSGTYVFTVFVAESEPRGPCPNSAASATRCAWAGLGLKIAGKVTLITPVLLTKSALENYLGSPFSSSSSSMILMRVQFYIESCTRLVQIESNLLLTGERESPLEHDIENVGAAFPHVRVQVVQLPLRQLKDGIAALYQGPERGGNLDSDVNNT